MGVRLAAASRVSRCAAPAAAGLCLLTAGCLPFKPSRPVAPGNALASPTTARSITLIWVDNSRDERGFRVERLDETADAAGVKSDRTTTVATLGKDTVRHEVTGLEPKTAYRFRVVAFNKVGDSLPSEVASASTLGLTLEEAIAATKPAVFLIRNEKNMGFFSTQQAYGFGTGFVIGSKRLATNEHVIRNAKQVAVRVNGSWLTATVISSDADNDIGIVEVDTPLPDPLSLGDSDQLREGAGIAAIGFPKVSDLTQVGFEIAPSTVPGIVSAIRTKEASSEGTSILGRLFPTRHSQIQMDAPINEGNSGGPVIEIATGKVIGLTVSRLQDAEGIKFAVPVNYLKTLMGRELLRSFGGDGDGSDFFSRWRARRYGGLNGPFSGFGSGSNGANPFLPGNSPSGGYNSPFSGGGSGNAPTYVPPWRSNSPSYTPPWRSDRP